MSSSYRIPKHRRSFLMKDAETWRANILAKPNRKEPDDRMKDLDTDYFWYDELHLPDWEMPKSLALKTPDWLIEIVTEFVESGAAVDTTLARLEHLEITACDRGWPEDTAVVFDKGYQAPEIKRADIVKGAIKAGGDEDASSVKVKPAIDLDPLPTGLRILDDFTSPIRNHSAFSAILETEPDYEAGADLSFPGPAPSSTMTSPLSSFSCTSDTSSKKIPGLYTDFSDATVSDYSTTASSVLETPPFTPEDIKAINIPTTIPEDPHYVAPLKLTETRDFTEDTKAGAARRTSDINRHSFPFTTMPAVRMVEPANLERALQEAKYVTVKHPSYNNPAGYPKDNTSYPFHQRSWDQFLKQFRLEMQGARHDDITRLKHARRNVTKAIQWVGKFGSREMKAGLSRDFLAKWAPWWAEARHKMGLRQCAVRVLCFPSLKEMYHIRKVHGLTT